MNQKEAAPDRQSMMSMTALEYAMESTIIDIVQCNCISKCKCMHTTLLIKHHLSNSVTVTLNNTDVILQEAQRLLTDYMGNWTSQTKQLMDSHGLSTCRHITLTKSCVADTVADFSYKIYIIFLGRSPASEQVLMQIQYSGTVQHYTTGRCETRQVLIFISMSYVNAMCGNIFLSIGL